MANFIADSADVYGDVTLGGVHNLVSKCFER